MFLDLFFIIIYGFFRDSSSLYPPEPPNISCGVGFTVCDILSLSSQAAWAKRVSLCAILLGDNYLFTFLFLC